jgi:hypothetical protein
MTAQIDKFPQRERPQLNPGFPIQRPSSIPPATPPQQKLLADIAIMLHLTAADAARLSAPNFLTGPSGMVCRLWLQPGSGAVRPEVLLPLRVREFHDADLDRLLKVQALLLDQLGWYLGASTDGRLSLMPLDWLNDAPATVAALDMANGIALSALSALIEVRDATQPQHQP